MKHRTLDYSTIDLMGRVSALGNHHQKYVVNIEKHFDTLVTLLDEQHLIDQIRLLRFSHDPYRAMQKIADLLHDQDTLLDLLGCYYAVQFLVMNLKAIDVLKLELFTTNSDQYHVMRSFLSRTGNDFRRLSRAYMSTLLDQFLPQKKRPAFIMCGVGTRVDQDDIDVGVIDEGKADRSVLTPAFAALYREMLKNACVLHFHLSEHVGDRGYSASIQEYHTLLDHKIHDFVLLSEMLNAVPILGQQRLFERFSQEILSRYYFRKDNNNIYHEGFLRGLLGEIHDLIMRVPSEDTLNPKKDGLRMIKAVIFALKTWKGTQKSTSLEVLDLLIKRDPINKEDYYRLYRSLTFLETFRFLYQLFVVQEEEISLQEENVFSNLETVALNMGYEDNAYAHAHTQLLIHYQDHLRLAEYATKRIVRHVTNHLGRITIFYPFDYSDQSEYSRKKYTGNLAQDFITAMEFFEGTRFWDDLLIAFDRQDGQVLDRFLTDFSQVPENEQQALIKAYVNWGKRSPYTLITLFTLIKQHEPQHARSELIQNFLWEFVTSIKRQLNDIGNFSKVLEYYPKKMYNFLAMLSEELLSRLIDILDTEIMNPEVNKTRQQLLDVCRLQYNSSYYFKRFIMRVFNTYHSHLVAFNEPQKFRQLSDGLLSNIENFDSIDEKIEKLGTYYDFEFMRLGINAIKGTYYGIINKEFTLFSDNYIQILFELCRQKVAKNYSHPPQTRDLLAVFVTGGHARSQAFDDDYDLIILINSDDQDKLAFANDIIIKMNNHIIKRSIMPHYRFADRFGHYVTTFSQLKTFFEDPDPQAFIDKSQILGARMVVGSANFDETFMQAIINPYIFQQKQAFITALIQEINSRHAYHRNLKILDIKESPGGLRDMENFLFILKAHFAERESISTKLFTILSGKLPAQEKMFDHLFKDYYFLKTVRDLYHLMVSDDDELQMKYLDNICQPLAKSTNREIKDAAQLEQKILTAMENNIQHITAIISHLGYHFKQVSAPPDRIANPYT